MTEGELTHIVPTPDGMVRFRIDGKPYLLLWPDALSLSYRFQAMAAVSAFHIGVKEDVMHSKCDELWDEAHAAAHAAMDRMHK